MVKILTFTGSLRKESLNKQLAQYATRKIRENEHVEAEFLDISAYPLPVFSADIETPENVTKPYNTFKEADAFIITCPEYNSSYSGALKNIIDWVSKVDLDCFAGKIVGIMSVSPGPMGGIRMLPKLRELLSNIHMIVVPTMTSIGGVSEIPEDFSNKRAEKTIAEVIELARKLKQEII